MYEQRALRAIRTGLLAGLCLCGSAAAQEAGGEKKPVPSPLTIEAITIEPAAPTFETLCQLRVKVRNSGEETVSALDFRVALSGEELPVYDKQLFLDTLPPGKVTEVRLYNFWTSETGRPAPSSGKLAVDVMLSEAQWVEIKTEEDGTEVWTLGEKVPGLPVAKRLTLVLEP